MPNINRVSISSGGTQANGSSRNASVSGNGRFIVFESSATNLVSGDTNSAWDVFLYDAQTRRISRMSTNARGQEIRSGSSGALAPAVAANGSRIVFHSNAGTFVSGDTNGQYDVFTRDVAAPRIGRVSVGTRGTQTETGASSAFPSISADGRYVTFESNASNLVSGDSNRQHDIFVRDTRTNTTTRVSVTSDGRQAGGGVAGSFSATIAGNGRRVAFESYATNLVAGDTNNQADVFVRDLQTNRTVCVSVTPRNTPANGGSTDPAISTDGRYVAFESSAADLVAGDTNGVGDIFRRDTQAGRTLRVSVGAGGAQANAVSSSPSMSADGRYVVFESGASNLVSGDTNGMWDIFLRDTQANRTVRLSVNAGGAQADGDSFSPSISADGRYATFRSIATNLVPNDTNGTWDIFRVEVASALGGTPAVRPAGTTRAARLAEALDIQSAAAPLTGASAGLTPTPARTKASPASSLLAPAGPLGGN